MVSCAWFAMCFISVARFDDLGAVKEIILNQGARLAHVLLSSLQTLLSPLHIVVSLGESGMSQRDVNAHENGLY